MYLWPGWWGLRYGLLEFLEMAILLMKEGIFPTGIGCSEILVLILWIGNQGLRVLRAFRGVSLSLLNGWFRSPEVVPAFAVVPRNDEREM